MNAFEIKRENKAVYIVNNTACHIDGEPFRYKQGDEIDADFLCKELNELHTCKETLSDIMSIIHNIKYGNSDWQDLDDFIYKGINIEDALHDELAKMIKVGE